MRPDRNDPRNHTKPHEQDHFYFVHFRGLFLPAEYQVRIGKTDLRVYSVDSETRLPVSRKMDQLQAVLDDLARFPRTMPAVVLGDFNSWEPTAVTRVRKLFTSAGFTTPFPDDESTFKRKIVVFDLKLKLDWIWLRGLKAESFGIDKSAKVSDHFPLWTVVKLGKQ